MAGYSKARFRTGASLGSLGLDVGLEGLSVIDYDRKGMRAALKSGAKTVATEAKRIVSRRAISAPGGMPGEQTGRLKRSIGIVTRGSKGGWVKIGPRTIKGSVFYPAFLFYGSPKTGLAKRGNFMVAALTSKRESVRSGIRAALKQSLVPR